MISIGLQDIKMLTKTITLCIKLVKWNRFKHDDGGDDDDDDDDNDDGDDNDDDDDDDDINWSIPIQFQLRLDAHFLHLRFNLQIDCYPRTCFQSKTIWASMVAMGSKNPSKSKW